MNSFEMQVADYAAILTNFVQKNNLPKEWFNEPDHLAFKAADANGFEELVAQFKPLSERVSCIDMDGRRLATAQLAENISVGVFGEVAWIELMEPRPAKAGKDVVGLEHMEFYYPHFDRVTEILKQKRISYEMQKNPGHAWVNIVLNNGRQELKLNDKPLGKTVQEEIVDERAYLL